MGVQDVLEAGNFVQNVIQTHADVGSTSPAGHGLALVLKVSQKSPQKSFFVEAPTKSAPNIICAFLKNSGFMQCANIQKKVNNVTNFTISQPL